MCANGPFFRPIDCFDVCEWAISRTGLRRSRVLVALRAALLLSVLSRGCFSLLHIFTIVPKQLGLHWAVLMALRVALLLSVLSRGCFSLSPEATEPYALLLIQCLIRLFDGAGYAY